MGEEANIGAIRVVSLAQELAHLDGLIREFQEMIDPDRPRETDKYWQRSIDELLDKRLELTQKPKTTA